MGVRQGEGRIPLDLTHHQHKLVIPGHVLRRIYNEQTHNQRCQPHRVGGAVLRSSAKRVAGPVSPLLSRVARAGPSRSIGPLPGGNIRFIAELNLRSRWARQFPPRGNDVGAMEQRSLDLGHSGVILMEMIRVFGLIAGFGFRSCVVPRSPHVRSRSSFGSTVLQPWQSAPMGNDSRSAEGDPGVRPGGLC